MKRRTAGATELKAVRSARPDRWAALTAIVGHSTARAWAEGICVPKVHGALVVQATTGVAVESWLTRVEQVDLAVARGES